MNRISKKLTYANVIASLALFLALGGASALAATQLAKNSVGTKQLKSGAVTTAKIKKEAVAGAKIKNAAVSEGKLADGAVSAAKLADGAVGTGKLVEAERSQVVASSASSAFDLVDTYNPETWTTVMSVNLPSGNWVVQASVAVSIGGETTHIGCRMVQGGKVLAQGGTEGQKLGFVPALDEVSLAAVAGAGQVTVNCGDSLDGTSAITRSLIATRAGSVAAG